jgi:xanthine dehydrogenase accessory factor
MSDAPRDHFTGPDAGADVYEWLARARRERTAAILLTVVATRGSAPQIPGAKLLVLHDGRAAGTIGGGAFEREALAWARALLDPGAPQTALRTLNLTRDLGMCCGGEMTIFAERVLGPERLVLFGAGHIARALADAAAKAGFAVTVVDEREEWATASRFPLAERIVCEEPELMLPEILLDEATYAVVVTHDHRLDESLVRSLLRSRARFVGLVASRTKRNKFLYRMRAQGLPEAQLARLRAPLGLALGAITPEEIAVSIVAELIAVRRGVLPPSGPPASSAPRRQDEVPSPKTVSPREESA